MKKIITILAATVLFFLISCASPQRDYVSFNSKVIDAHEKTVNAWVKDRAKFADFAGKLLKSLEKVDFTDKNEIFSELSGIKPVNSKVEEIIRKAIAEWRAINKTFKKEE